MSAYSFEDIAAATRLRERKPTPGVKYARKQCLRSGDGWDDPHKFKNFARSLVGARLRDEEWNSHLRILTMPGIKWCFERSILGCRKRTPEATTEIWSIERDAAIYRAAIRKMPGQSLTCGPGWISSDKIHRFHFGTVEEFIEREDIPERSDKMLTGGCFLGELRN